MTSKHIRSLEIRIQELSSTLICSVALMNLIEKPGKSASTMTNAGTCKGKNVKGERRRQRLRSEIDERKKKMVFVRIRRRMRGFSPTVRNTVEVRTLCVPFQPGLPSRQYLSCEGQLTFVRCCVCYCRFAVRALAVRIGRACWKEQVS